MSKQVLDVQQMQHLQELGLKLDYNTILSWIVDDRDKDKPLLCISSDAVDYVDFSHYCLPAYTLQDVLDALPESILKNDIQYWLSICRVSISIWMGSYSDDVDLTTNLHHEENESLIDAAYELLVWAIENKFVETNKNE